MPQPLPTRRPTPTKRPSTTLVTEWEQMDEAIDGKGPLDLIHNPVPGGAWYLHPLSTIAKPAGAYYSSSPKANGVIYYRGTPTSEVVNHERIHAYQDQMETKLGIKPPSYKTLQQSIITDYPSPYPHANSDLELPAMSFGDEHPKAQQDFNRYVDEYYTKSKGRSSPIETLLPPNLHKEYIKSHPRPITPPVLDIDIPKTKKSGLDRLKELLMGS